MRQELSAAVNVLKETVAEAAENAVCKATQIIFEFDLKLFQIDNLTNSLFIKIRGTEYV